MSGKSESPINVALRHLEAAEANLEKLERIFEESQKRIPTGITFGKDDVYEELRRSFADVLLALPAIDGWKPTCQLVDLDDVANSRMEAAEFGEIGMMNSAEEAIDEPGRQLNEYRHKFNGKRRELSRGAILEALGRFDDSLGKVRRKFPKSKSQVGSVEGPEWEELRGIQREIETLLGSVSSRPPRWVDLKRHLAFAKLCDLTDIETIDWPEVKAMLNRGIYEQNEPIPVGIDDLGTLAATHPEGRVTTQLNWKSLTADDFERLIYSLINATKGYENANWLTKTNAPDRGRDLSVLRVVNDLLGGTSRARVIIQCRHKPNKSVNVADVAELREQMIQWEPPRVDVLVIATTGRFTNDAIALIEKQNGGNQNLKIEMWPESHIERLLTERPSLIAEFNLR